MIRVLRVARSSSVKPRTQAVNALKDLVVTTPDHLRERLRGLPRYELVATASRLRPGSVTSP